MPSFPIPARLLLPSAKVAVVTRTKNRPLLLARALESIFDQTCSSLIWVIVNDGGDPAAVDLVAADAVSRGVATVVVHHATSLGMEAASNAGVNAVDSDYVVLHDDDDSWDPSFLKETTRFLDAEPIWGGVVTSTSRIDERLDATGVHFVRKRPFNPNLKSVHLSEMAEENSFPPISFLFRRSAYDAIGPYDTSLAVLGDWEFNLRFLARYDIGVIDRPLANYHWRVGATCGYGNSVSGGIDRHVQWDAVVRNRLLRRDLDAGTVGLGHLVASGRRQIALNKTLRPLSIARGAAKRVVLGLRRVTGAA